MNAKAQPGSSITVERMPATAMARSCSPSAMPLTMSEDEAAAQTA